MIPERLKLWWKNLSNPYRIYERNDGKFVFYWQKVDGQPGTYWDVWERYDSYEEAIADVQRWENENFNKQIKKRWL